MNLRISYRTSICATFFLISVFLSIFRWNVGIDWSMYYNQFNKGIHVGASIFEEHMEPLNILISNVLVFCGLNDGRYWIGVMALISMYFVYNNISVYSTSVWKSILLFFIVGFFFDSLNTVRQFCAISITVYSWRYVLQKQLVKFLLVVLLASLFHTSALSTLIIYFFPHVRFSKRWVTKILIVALIIAPISTLVAPKLIGLIPAYEQYMDKSVIKYATGSGNVLSYLRMIYPSFLLLIMRGNLKVLYINSYWKLLTNISILGLFILIAFPTTQLMIRLAYYFYFALIFIIPYLFSKIKFPNGKFLWIFTVVYFCIYTYITYLSRSASKITPYTMRFDLCNWQLLVLIVVVVLSLQLLFSSSKQSVSLQKQH